MFLAVSCKLEEFLFRFWRVGITLAWHFLWRQCIVAGTIRHWKARIRYKNMRDSFNLQKKCIQLGKEMIWNFTANLWTWTFPWELYVQFKWICFGPSFHSYQNHTARTLIFKVVSLFSAFWVYLSSFPMPPPYTSCTLMYQLCKCQPIIYACHWHRLWSWPYLNLLNLLITHKIALTRSVSCSITRPLGVYSRGCLADNHLLLFLWRVWRTLLHEGRVPDLSRFLKQSMYVSCQCTHGKTAFRQTLNKSASAVHIQQLTLYKASKMYAGLFYEYKKCGDCRWWRYCWAHIGFQSQRCHAVIELYRFKNVGL